MSLPFVRRVAIVALTLPLLLGGCSEDEPVPKMPDTSSPSPTADETTTEPTEPVEPTLPPEAKGKGVKAAEAFVRHYLAVVDFSRATLDPSHMRKWSSPACKGCNGIGDLLEEVAHNGGQVVGGDQVVDAVQATELDAPGDNAVFRATATVHTTRQEIRGSGVGGLDGVRQPETCVTRSCYCAATQRGT